MKKIAIMVVLIGLTVPSFGQKKAKIERLRLFKKDKTDELEPTLFWAQYDATRRGSMIFIDADQRVRILSENPPDVAVESIIGITAKVKGIEGVGEAEAAFNAQKSIADMAKRTASVNMLRDALYRLNELYYATVDEKREILKTISISGIENLKALSEPEKQKMIFNPTISNNEIKELFEKVIECMKDIAIEEAKVSIEEEKAKIEKANSETEKYKTLQSIVEKMDGDLTKKEALELIEKLK